MSRIYQAQIVLLKRSRIPSICDQIKTLLRADERDSVVAETSQTTNLRLTFPLLQSQKKE